MQDQILQRKYQQALTQLSQATDAALTFAAENSILKEQLMERDRQIAELIADKAAVGEPAVPIETNGKGKAVHEQRRK